MELLPFIFVESEAIRMYVKHVPICGNTSELYLTKLVKRVEEKPNFKYQRTANLFYMVWSFEEIQNLIVFNIFATTNFNKILKLDILNFPKWGMMQASTHKSTWKFLGRH